MFEHRDITSIKLEDLDGNAIYKKSRNNVSNRYAITYDSFILDPVDKSKIAKIYILYSNEHLLKFNDRIIIVLLFTLGFAVCVFLTAFFYLKGDLIALRKISEALEQYAVTSDTTFIIHQSRSKEISTIAKIANQMFFNMAKYLDELKSFNGQLEKKVKEEIEKQQNQERLMIHQSRQAAMGEMLESIAHQWRQPLNIIGLATVNMDMEYKFKTLDDKKFDEKIEIISTNINYMSDTIDDFRNFLNPNREMREFNPKKSINDVFHILDAQLKNYGIVYNMEDDCDFNFYGVENEFKQVMLILINNSKDAIKSLMGKTNKGKIEIIFKCEDNRGIIELSDNGGGIKDDIINSIFDAYFTTKFNAKGTGIGLYLAKNIIESRMDGVLSVKNIDGGCCFIIDIPIAGDNS
ncbi:MAG: HAMP domain-containing histidine kinase [Campylobacterales bacterium]|nr:HAMP domain-containing histidine kinase [Campylobacterales bacterium]